MTEIAAPEGNLQRWVILCCFDRALLSTGNGRFHRALATGPRPARTQRQGDCLSSSPTNITLLSEPAAEQKLHGKEK